MRLYTTIVLFLLLTQTLFPQAKIETDIESALINAKKGVYWALSNIPAKKSKIEMDLIFGDKLIASTKLSKEVEGVKVESTGYFDTNEVTIIIYRSNDSLIKDGYIKKEKLDPNSKGE